MIKTEDILNFLVQNSTINLSDVEIAMKKQKLKEILEKHPYSIYQGNDSRWYTTVADQSKKDKRRKIAKATEEELHQALYEYYEGVESKKGMTLRKLYPEWLEFKALHTTAETYITRIESDWKKYYVNDDIVDIPIVKLKKLVLDEWLHSLIKTHNMTKTQYYNVTVIIRQTLMYAVDLGIIDSSPMNSVKVDGKRLFQKKRKKADNTQVYSKDELAKLKELAWKDFKNRVKIYELAPLAVLFQFQTGVRISELCVLMYSDIEGDYIHVQRMLRRDTKEIVEHTKGTYGDRKVYLSTEAREIIKATKERQEELGIAFTDYIFSINELPPTIHSISDLYRKYCDKLGIVKKSSHKSRKTYISTLIDGNVNINTIREMVGHSDERTTFENYCFDRSNDEEKAMKIEKALSESA